MKDKYGLSWQVVPTALNEMLTTATPEQLARVTQAFLPMKKFDLAALQRAYDGVTEQSAAEPLSPTSCEQLVQHADEHRRTAHQAEHLAHEAANQAAGVGADVDHDGIQRHLVAHHVDVGAGANLDVHGAAALHAHEPGRRTRVAIGDRNGRGHRHGER